MGSEKKLPKGLAEKQEIQRQETINKVLRTIADIKNEGRNVTISTLVEFTGLSRSVFAKSHIRELIVDYGCTLSDNEKGFIKQRKCNKTENISEKDS